MKIKEEFHKYVPDREKRCAAIIHGAAAASAGAAAAAPFPGSDFVAIAPIQVAMIVALADEFGAPFSDAGVKSALYAGLGRIVGRGGAGLLLRWLPGYGNVVRAGVAASVTEALGWTAVKKLKADGSIL